MRLSLRPIMTFLLIPFAFLIATASPSRSAERLPMSPMSAHAMTPEETIWFNRTLAAMDASNVLINNTMLTGDSYAIGRDGGNYTQALLMAYRATGDRRFLDRVYELSELARTKLRDAWLDGTTDGFTDWNWLIDPANATYYGKDTNWLDESIASGNAAMWAYAFHSNRALDPRYAAAADFWRDWCENEFLAKWYQRVGGDPLVAWNTPYAAFYKPDTEPRSANWRLAYYLWKVTGNTFYRDRADQIRTELIGANEINPAHPRAYRWTKETSPSSQTWQLVNYANYYIRVVIEMNLEGVPFFSSPVEMKRFAAAFREVIYANTMPGRTTMTNDVSGGGSTSFSVYAFNGLSAWDSTGFLMNLANVSITGVGNYAPGGLSKAARNDVFMSSYALMALSPAGPTPTLVASFMADPLDDGTVRIQWEMTSTEGSVATNVYRVAPNGVERTLVNPTPIAGGGTHVVIDESPLEAETLTYELFEVTSDGEHSVGRIAVARGEPIGRRVSLEQNGPNPFSASTLISFAIPEAMHVRLAIYDTSGRLVRVLENASLSAGRYSRTWDGRNTDGRAMPNGSYFYAAETGGKRVVRRAILMR